MKNSSAMYSAPGLGAVLALDDTDNIIAAGLYGPGFDGDFRSLTCSDPDSAGTFKVYQPAGQGDSREWPDSRGHSMGESIGSVSFARSEDGSVLTVAFAINRKALGDTDTGFSPPPPADVEGFIALNRLA